MIRWNTCNVFACNTLHANCATNSHCSTDQHSVSLTTLLLNKRYKGTTKMTSDRMSFMWRSKMQTGSRKDSKTRPHTRCTVPYNALDRAVTGYWVCQPCCLAGVAVSSRGADGWISEGNTDEVPVKMWSGGSDCVWQRSPAYSTALQHDSPLSPARLLSSIPPRLSPCPLAPV